jgi:hypothetical protein
MVDVRMRPGQSQPAPEQAPEQAKVNPRHARRNRRLQALKDARPVKGTVRVVPTNDKFRGVLKHIPSGKGFSASGGATWPNDKFTQRRLRDGSVKLEEAKQEKEQATNLSARPSSQAPA